MNDTPDALNAYEIYSEASDMVLSPGATEKDRALAFALVDGLHDKNLSAMIRSTAGSWTGNEERVKASEPNAPEDSVAYDYDDEDGAEDYESEL